MKFTLITNCQALVFLNTQKTKNPQLTRWANTLYEYDFTTRHRKGSQIRHVDALSRAPIGSEKNENLSEAKMFGVVNCEDDLLLYQ